MSEINTSAEAVERILQVLTGPSYCIPGSLIAATLRALAAERDALNLTLTNERKHIESLQQFMVSQGVRIDRIEAELSAARAEAARLREAVTEALNVNGGTSLHVFDMVATIRGILRTALAQKDAGHE